MPIGFFAVSSCEKPAGLEFVIQRTAPGLPDLPASRFTWLSNSVVDRLLLSSVVTTRRISLEKAGTETNVKLAARQSVFPSIIPSL
jgi:hypothetical protein